MKNNILYYLRRRDETTGEYDYWTKAVHWGKEPKMYSMRSHATHAMRDLPFHYKQGAELVTVQFVEVSSELLA
jgi:hypothetical protein